MSIKNDENLIKIESLSADNHFILQGHASVRMFEGVIKMT